MRRRKKAHTHVRAETNLRYKRRDDHTLRRSLVKASRSCKKNGHNTETCTAMQDILGGKNCLCVSCADVNDKIQLLVHNVRTNFNQEDGSCQAKEHHGET